MNSLKTRLTSVFSNAFAELGYESGAGEVVVSDRPDLAPFQCNGALGQGKRTKRNPREVAAQVVARVAALDPGLELSIAGPGFINVRPSDARLADEANQIARDSRLGVTPAASRRSVVVDYGGPNVAKSMHVGHLRSSIIGDSIVRIHRFMGDAVVGDNHIGDWGTPMGMCIAELHRERPDLPYFDANAQGPFPPESPVTMADLERIYPLAAKRFKADEAFAAECLVITAALQQGTHPGYRALWRHFLDTTVTEMGRDFAELGIRFDTWRGESFYQDRMPGMVERLQRERIAVESEGAWVIPLATEQEPDMPPLILVKTGGGFLYHTSDLATIEQRAHDDRFDLAIYVVDKRQSLHFQQVFSAARRTGLAGQMETVHAGFGTMNGTDGKPFKTREGGVLKLRDLIGLIYEEARKRLAEMELGYAADELEAIARKVGIATLKYADLKNNRSSDYVFDLERFARFEGNTGPYQLYAVVRIKSILRKAAEQGFVPGPIVAPTTEVERRLVLEALRLPDMVRRAYDNDEPHHLADHAFALSQAFNAFYKECHILREPDAARRASWLGLARLAHDQIELCLDLLGISVPERM